MRKVLVGFVGLVLASAAGRAAGAPFPEPLGPASEGRLQCFDPNAAAKTCRSTASYRPAGDIILNLASVMVSADPVTVMRTVTPVQVVAGAVCGTLRARHIGEAEALSRQVWDIRRRVLGAEHPDTLMSANFLATNLVAHGRNEEAEAALGQVTAAMAARSAGGATPPHELIIYLSNLGDVRLRLSRAEGTYSAYSMATAGPRARYRDQGASGGGDDARADLTRDRDVFQGQITSGWAWAHQP